MDPKAPRAWRNVTGRRSRQLLRHLDHTAAVHGFLGEMAMQARRQGWKVVQLDPPMRAARHFRYGGRLHSIHPDAFGVLRCESRTWSFYLEWERRAVRPSTMLERLAPYLRYYSTHQPMDDHGMQPSLLTVFQKNSTAVHFLQIARKQMKTAGIHLPLWAWDKVDLDNAGPITFPWELRQDEKGG